VREPKPPRFDLDALLAEIPQDEAVCRTAPRLLSQDDIRRLIEESRRRKERAAPRVSPHEK
jgi:hypothetical protein